MDDDQSNNQQVADNNNDNDSNASRLAEVKARALESLLPLVQQANEFSPEKRFDIYMSAVRNSGNAQSAEDALEAALAIEDQSSRASALSELIDEVEYAEIKNV